MANFFRRKPFLFITLWFAILPLIFTFPLIFHCTQEVAGQIGDNIYFVWMVGWVQKALFTLKTNPMNVWFLNYPEGWNLARTEMAPMQLLLAMPFSLIGGEVFGYNMAMLASFFLSGLFMCLWIRHLSGSNWAGIISGTIFACLPYRQAHFLAGHLNLAGTQWLPLFFWGWFDLLNAEMGGKVRWKSALLAAFGLGATALCSQYYVFMLLIIAGFQAFMTLIFFKRDQLKNRKFWLAMGCFALFSLPLLAMAEIPFLKLAGSGGMPDRDWGSVRNHSAGLTDYFLPGTTHFLFGKWVGAHFNRDYWIEATLYIGIISLGLAIYGFARRKTQDRLTWQVLISGIVIALILSMGTDLHWNGAPVSLTLPAFLQEKLGRETLPIVLPGLFLFKYFPFYGKLRAMMRFGLFVLIFISGAAGFGVRAALDRTAGTRFRVILPILILALAILDFLPAAQKSFVPVGPRKADLYLQKYSGKGSVMRYPFYLNDDQAGTYYTLYNNKPFIGGFFNAFPTEQYQRISGVMNSFPSEESLKTAKALRVEYFLIETSEVEAAIQRADGSLPWNSLDELLSACEKNGLTRYGTFDDVMLYQFYEECDICKWKKEKQP